MEIRELERDGLSELKCQLASGYDDLIKEWNYFGHSKEEIYKKKKDFEAKHKAFLKNVLSEEIEKGNWKESEIDLIRINIKQYSERLDKEEPTLQKERGNEKVPLFELEIQLLDVLKKLTIDLYNKLKDEANEFASQLDESPPSFPKVDSGETEPDDKTISELTIFIEQMVKEKENRQSLIHKLRMSILENYLKLGISTSGDEEFILKNETILSKKLIDQLKVLQRSLVKKNFEGETILKSSIPLTNPEIPSQSIDIESLIGTAIGNMNQITNLLSFSPADQNQSSDVEDDNEIKCDIKIKKDIIESKFESQLEREMSPELEIIEEIGENVNKRKSRENFNSSIKWKFAKYENRAMSQEDYEQTYKMKYPSGKRPKKVLLMKADNSEEKFKKEEFKWLTEDEGALDEKNEIEIVELSDNSDAEDKLDIKREIQSKPSLKSEIKVESKAKLKNKTKKKPKQENGDDSDSDWEKIFSSEEEEEEEVKVEERRVPRIKNYIPSNYTPSRHHYSKAEDLKILKIIGSSDWYHHTTGYTIWDEMAEREEGFPNRSASSLRSHFIIVLIKKMKLYKISRRERKKYALSYTKKFEGKMGHLNPMNLDYESYNLF